MDNLAYYFIILILVAFIFLVLGTIYAVAKKYRRPIYKKLRKAANDFFWNGFIRSTSLSYLKSFVAVALAIKLVAAKGHADPSIMVTILILFSVIVFPAWAAYFMIHNKSKLSDKKFHGKFQSLYAGVKVNELSELLYPSVFLIRRALFVLLATTPDGYPYI